ncbi:MAG: GFA family protein [Steroidobacteraceae bacterium]
MTAQTMTGRCFCGDVEVTVTGEPAAMGYCHCDSCRHWSAGPVNAFSLWKPDAVRITKGADKLGSFARTPNSHRKWCKTCGGHVLAEHPGMGLTDVYAAILPKLAFEPGLHVFYAETVLHIHDGLPKLKDVPKELGGSGETLAE